MQSNAAIAKLKREKHLKGKLNLGFTNSGADEENTKLKRAGLNTNEANLTYAGLLMRRVRSMWMRSGAGEGKPTQVNDLKEIDISI